MSLNFSVRGEGEPLVLVHGLFGSLENLGALARLLAENFRVYSIDLPNHGRSPHLEAFSLSDIAEQIHEWMVEQSIESADFVGHSLGGKAVMELAMTKPSLVRSCAVMDIAPVIYNNRHEAVFEGLLAIDPSALKLRSEADEQLKAYVPELAVRNFLLKNLSKKVDGGFEWRMNLAAIASAYPKLIGENSKSVFDGPVLFLKGSNSDYIVEDYREAILKRFPKAKLRVVSETGHWLHAEKPDLVASILGRFFSDQAS